MDVIAHLYNHSMATHDGEQEAVMCIKDSAEHGIYVDGVATLDLERTRADVIRPTPWQTDTSIGPWGFHSGAAYRPASEIIHELIDIVSKNGNLLLNVPPLADGTLDPETHDILADIGAWLEVNGEAIYGTRPWITPGTGDIRFTRKGNAVYVLATALPDAGLALAVPELGERGGVGHVGCVSLLGHDGELRWSQDKNNLDWTTLRIIVPDGLPPAPAHAFRIDFE
jgi:alpha-L-fucosidase